MAMRFSRAGSSFLLVIFLFGLNVLAAELRAEGRLLQSRCSGIRPPQAKSTLRLRREDVPPDRLRSGGTTNISPAALTASAAAICSPSDLFLQLCHSNSRRIFFRFFGFSKTPKILIILKFLLNPHEFLIG
jgi:hypothetical protein